MKNIDTFELKFPLRRVHTGMPVSNSRLGALIFGEGRALEICVCESSNFDHRFGKKLWDPKPYSKIVELYDPYDVTPINDFLKESTHQCNDVFNDIWWPSTRLGGGRIIFTLAEELELIRLRYSSGKIEAQTVSGKIIEFIISLSSNDLLVFDPQKLIIKQQTVPMWDKLKDILLQVGFKAPERFEDGWFQPVPKDPGLDVRSRKTPYGRVIQVNLVNSPREFPLPDPEKVRKQTAEWFADYWHESTSVELPDPFFNRFFKFAQYKFAVSTMPGGKAAALQGPFLEDYQKPPWSCDYHFNVNIQQIYTFGFGIGRPGHLMPLFNMLESDKFYNNMRDNARSLFGIDDGIILTHAVDDWGMQCGGLGVGAVLDFACAGWVATLYYNYYQYTLDREFLRNRAWKFMYATMRALECALEFNDGKYSLPVSISAEYGCTFKVEKDGRLCSQNSGRDPSNQLTMIHYLLNCLIESSKILNLELPEKWLDIKEKLPRFTSNGERVILWKGQDLDVCHRHHSHLAMIYPFDLMDEMTENELQMIDNAIEHWIWLGMGQWTEWCYPWAAIIHARFGLSESPVQLLNLWKSLFVNESQATVYLPKYRGLTSHRITDIQKPRETSEVIQLDGTMAGATAIMELLVQKHGDTIKLFPAVPEEWVDVAFENIRLPGGITVSARREHGRTVECTLHATAPTTVKLQLDSDSCLLEYELNRNRKIEIVSRRKE